MDAGISCHDSWFMVDNYIYSNSRVRKQLLKKLVLQGRRNADEPAKGSSGVAHANVGKSVCPESLTTLTLNLRVHEVRLFGSAEHSRSQSNHSVPGTTSVGTRTAASRADPPRSGCAARASTGGFSGQGFRSGRRLSIVLFVSMLGWLARQMLWSPDSSFEVQAAVASSEKKCQARDINIVRAGCQAGARCACSKNEA